MNDNRIISSNIHSPLFPAFVLYLKDKVREMPASFRFLHESLLFAFVYVNNESPLRGNTKFAYKYVTKKYQKELNPEIVMTLRACQ